MGSPGADTVHDEYPDVTRSGYPFDLLVWRHVVLHDADGTLSVRIKFPGWGTVAIALAGTVCAVALARLVYVLSAGQIPRTPTLIVTSLAGAGAAIGMWLAPAFAWIAGSRRPTALEYDPRSGRVRLPRHGEAFAREDLLRIEFVQFDVRGYQSLNRKKYLVLVVRSTDQAERRIVLLAEWGANVRFAADLARSLDVPHTERTLPRLRL